MESSDEELDFEEQIRLQEEAEKAKEDAMSGSRIRKDSDGTVYEWDSDKKAWFPKIDADFLAQYQMNYGTDESKAQAKADAAASASQQTSIPPAPSNINSEEYRKWYYTYYASTAAAQTTTADPSKSAALTSTTSTTDSKDYEEYYRNYYYQYYQQNASSSSKTGEKVEGEVKGSGGGQGEEKEKDEGKEEDDKDKKAREEYDAYYQEYYKQFGGEQKDPADMTEEEMMHHQEAWHKYYEYYYGKQPDQNPQAEKSKGEGSETKSEEKKEEEKGEKDGKKGKKRKAENKKPPEWFQPTEEKNTNIYVTGLPEDITMEEFETLMKRFGLIMFDPFTRKPKLKLYKDKDGKYKGDGLCCYIKQESVQLCLDLMDGSDIRGYKVYVERAKFEKKGEFNPNIAKKKKLSNKQKRKLKEKQEKLFAWKPDLQEDSGRQRFERIIVVRNCFDPKMFDAQPALINDVRDNLRDECNNHAEVKKVNVYDRHVEGVCTVAFQTPEDADICIKAINGRFFRGRVIKVATWDGKTKYDVEETEEERQRRIKQWNDFLESGGEDNKGEGKKESTKVETKSDNESTSSSAHSNEGGKEEAMEQERVEVSEQGSAENGKECVVEGEEESGAASEGDSGQKSASSESVVEGSAASEHVDKTEEMETADS